MSNLTDDSCSSPYFDLGKSAAACEAGLKAVEAASQTLLRFLKINPVYLLDYGTHIKILKFKVWNLIL